MATEIERLEAYTATQIGSVVAVAPPIAGSYATYEGVVGAGAHVITNLGSGFTGGTPDNFTETVDYASIDADTLTISDVEHTAPIRITASNAGGSAFVDMPLNIVAAANPPTAGVLAPFIGVQGSGPHSVDLSLGFGGGTPTSYTSSEAWLVVDNVGVGPTGTIADVTKALSSVNITGTNADGSSDPVPMDVTINAAGTQHVLQGDGSTQWVAGAETTYDTVIADGPYAGTVPQFAKADLATGPKNLVLADGVTGLPYARGEINPDVPLYYERGSWAYDDALGEPVETVVWKKGAVDVTPTDWAAYVQDGTEGVDGLTIEVTLTQPVGPVSTTAIGTVIPVATSDIAIAFQGGSKGYWLDVSDPDRRWTTNSKTTKSVLHGDGVGYVQDKSGNKKNYNQTTQAKIPTLAIDGSSAGIEFDGVDDALSMVTGFVSGELTNDMFLAIAMKVNSAGDWVALSGGVSELVGMAQSGSGSASFLRCGSPTFSIDGVAVTAATRGQLYTEVGINTHVVLGVHGLDLTDSDFSAHDITSRTNGTDFQGHVTMLGSVLIETQTTQVEADIIAELMLLRP